MKLLAKQSYQGVIQRIHKEPGRKTLHQKTSSFKERVCGMAAGIIFILIIPSLLFAQDFTQTIERSARFSSPDNPDNALRVYNIQGSVTVEGYDGSEIQITARQQIDGTDEEVARAREELEFVVDEDGDKVYVYLDAPFIDVEKEKSRLHYRIEDWDDDYEFSYDITIRVPENAKIYASTINNGVVSIRNTTSSITASNVNGKIELTNIAGPTEANTVNGDIDIVYAQSPAQDSEYHTVNGTIDVKYPADLSADIRFKSMNGELYTDFDNIKRLNAQINTNKNSSGSAVRYKVDKFSPIRIGNGGPTFNFEVLNGDVYIRRIQS